MSKQLEACERGLGKNRELKSIIRTVRVGEISDREKRKDLRSEPLECPNERAEKEENGGQRSEGKIR